MQKSRSGNGAGEGGLIVPPGGYLMLAAVGAILLALACKIVGGMLPALFVPGQLLLAATALILVGASLRRAFSQGGGRTVSTLTGGVILRLICVLGVIVLLFGGTVFLTSPAESQRIEEVTEAPTAPGGGLPDGMARNQFGVPLHTLDADGQPLKEPPPPPPYPWLSYTYMVAGFLGVGLALLVSLGLLTRWAIWQEFTQDEPGIGEAQTSTLILFAVAAVIAQLAYVSLDPAWNSGRSLICVMTLVICLGAMFLILPIGWRKFMAVALILIHFGGILTAVTSVPPPNAPAPWVTTKVWASFYRPYLEFAYLNNAYHFYSPEPGQACLLWSRLEYTDGNYRWVKLPSRSEEAIPMTYQRLLAITESINQIGQPTGDMRRKEEQRQKAVLTKGIELHPEMPLQFQYREPDVSAKELLGTYARFLARQHPERNDKPLAKMKIYRVPHGIVPAPLVALGRRADDPWMYFPFYQGEYDAEGKLLNPDDPLLYWLIPILPRDLNNPDRNEINDYLARHAGDR